MPTRDANLSVNPASWPLIANAVSAVQEVEGTPINGMAVQVNIKATPTGTTPTLTVLVHASTSTAPTTASEIVGQSPALNAAGEYIVPFVTNKRTVIVEFALTGTSPNFSSVEAHIVQNVGYSWSRLVEFH